MDYLTSLWQKAMESGFLSDMAIAVLLVCAVLLYFVVRYIPLEAAIPFFFKDKEGKKVARGFFGAPLLIIICALVLMLIPAPSKAQV
jgi:asparagine N-glycosylation enzyme membrane subunit Stt3